VDGWYFNYTRLLKYGTTDGAVSCRTSANRNDGAAMADATCDSSELGRVAE
jgi:hypothetical protein